MTGHVTSQKAVLRTQWDDAAAGWERHGQMIRDWLRNPTAALLEMANVTTGQTVLDVAAGAGDQSLDLAARVGPAGTVVATDISAAMLGFAEANARAAGYRNLRIHVADAQHLDLPEGIFDAAICRLGLMFLPDPLAGLSGVLRTLKTGARFCSLVFAGPDQNPCLGILMSTAMRHAGLPPRDPFQPGGLVSLGRAGHLDDLYRRAGFQGVATTRMEAPIELPTTADYLAFIRDAAGPIVQILSTLGPPKRAAAWADISTQLEVFQRPGGWSGPNTLLLTAGHR